MGLITQYMSRKRCSAAFGAMPCRSPAWPPLLSIFLSQPRLGLHMSLLRPLEQVSSISSPSAHRGQQCALQRTVEVLSKEHLLGELSALPRSSGICHLQVLCGMLSEPLRLPLMSPGLTTSLGLQLTQTLGAEGSLDHNIPVTSLSTSIRKPKEVQMRPRSASDRPRPEWHCPPLNLCSPPFPSCISINNLANIPSLSWR